SQTLRVVRLDNVVGGTEADGFDDRRGLIPPREHDDLGLGPARLEGLQRREAVESGHHDVEQHDVRRVPLLGRRHALGAGGVGPSLIAPKLQERPQVGRKGGIIVHDRHVGFAHSGYQVFNVCTSAATRVQVVDDSLWVTRFTTEGEKYQDTVPRKALVFYS